MRQVKWKACGQEIALFPHALLMGILNVTPDSFSDGGQYLDPIKAGDRAQQMVEEGAGMIDIGAESSRPGADPIPEDEELRRIIPVLRQVGKRLRVPISIDTTKSAVAQQALDLGASVINDISALQDDLRLAQIVANHRAGLVLMHCQGSPRTMQQNPQYRDVMGSIHSFLKKQVFVAQQAGIPQDQIILDPGIGFGKTVEHNLTILARIQELSELGRPILIGPSRKSFIGKVLGVTQEERSMGTAAAILMALSQGVRLFRVHDVKEMFQAVRMAEAIMAAEVP